MRRVTGQSVYATPRASFPRLIHNSVGFCLSTLAILNADAEPAHKGHPQSRGKLKASLTIVPPFAHPSHLALSYVRWRVRWMAGSDLVSAGLRRWTMLPRKGSKKITAYVISRRLRAFFNTECRAFAFNRCRTKLKSEEIPLFRRFAKRLCSSVSRSYHEDMLLMDDRAEYDDMREIIPRSSLLAPGDDDGAQRGTRTSQWKRTFYSLPERSNGQKAAVNVTTLHANVKYN